VADPEFYNGGRGSRGRVLDRGLCAPSPEKNEFLPEIGGFWCILLGLLFTFMHKKWSGQWGAAAPAPALNPPLWGYGDD